MENGQVRASLQDHLDSCCRQIGELFGKPDTASWTNSDYIKLGYILHKKTKVQISPNTLKRIFGKLKTDGDYHPQKATRDALVQYIGFRDWEHFVENDTPVVGERPQPSFVSNKPPKTPAALRERRTRPFWQKTKQRWLILASLFTVICLVAWLSYEGLIFQSPEVKISLVCSNPVGNNPHSAAFIIRGMTSRPGERYTIDFGDGKKITTGPGDSLYSHYYEVPGRFLAVIKKEGVPLDTVPVFLQTKKWTATASMMYDTTRVYPINTVLPGKSGNIALNAVDMARAGVDTNRTFFVNFTNTQFTDIDGDNFDLFVKLKTSEERPGVRCSQVRITVFGEQSKHLVDVMKPGCEHWSDIQLSEITKAGEFNKLDFLGVDLHRGGTINLNVQDRHANLYINSKKVFGAVYRKPLKKVYGLGITFSGIGEIQSVVLKDLRTGHLFDGNF